MIVQFNLRGKFTLAIYVFEQMLLKHFHRTRNLNITFI